MGRKALEPGDKTLQISFKIPSKYHAWLSSQLEEYQTIADYCRRIVVRYCKANGFKEENKSK